MNLRSRRTTIVAGSVLAAALLAGGTIALTSIASADESGAESAVVATGSAQDGLADDATTPAPGDARRPAGGPGDAAGSGGGPGGAADGQAGGMQGPPPGVEALTGTDLEAVRAAVLAEYPGGTVVQAEADADGGYRAHVSTADGDLLLVELDEAFTVTGSTADSVPGGGTSPST